MIERNEHLISFFYNSDYVFVGANCHCCSNWSEKLIKQNI